MITDKRLADFHDKVVVLEARNSCLNELLDIVLAEGYKSADNRDAVEARIWLKVAKIIGGKCDEVCDQSGKLLTELTGEEA